MGVDIVVTLKEKDHLEKEKEIIDLIEKNIELGLISIKRIEESYQRIRNFKLKYLR